MVNGKPLIFELYGETLNEKNGILSLTKNILDFKEVPIGYMNYISSPFEIKNISSIKIKYMIDKAEIVKFNEFHEFEIFKIENYEGSIGPGESRYLIVHFKPLAEIEYKLDLDLYYTDEINTSQMKITIIGKGYHPLKVVNTVDSASFSKMPNSIVCKYFNNQMIQKCGFSLEDLNFGVINKPKHKTFILYNFSEDNSLNFDFNEPNFLIKDELQIIPNKGQLDPGKYKIIKCILSPNEGTNNDYEGDILVRIAWNIKSNKLLNNNINILPAPMTSGKLKNKNLLESIGNVSSSNFNIINNPINIGGGSVSRIEKENLYLRISKKSELSKDKKILSGSFNLDCNSSFVELIITKLAQEILNSHDFVESFNTKIESQPLSLYKWTHNDICTSIKETREKFIKNLKMKIVNLYGDLSQVNTSGYKRTTIRSEVRTMTIRKQSVRIPENIVKEKFDEELVNIIDEKYLNEVVEKYKYNIKDINEKIIIVNDDTKKLIIDTIMENTIYNIISEAVYGELDLTQKQRIYFFLDKNANIIKNENVKNGEISKEKEKEKENKGSKNIENINKSNNENKDRKIIENSNKELLKFDDEQKEQ